MNSLSADRIHNLSLEQRLLQDDWSDLGQYRDMPEIDFERMAAYRISRLRQQLELNDAAMCLLLNPISLRYAVDYSSYQLFQSHIPTSYLFLAQQGPTVMYGAYEEVPMVDDYRAARAHSYFDGGSNIHIEADRLADDVVNYLAEIGSDNRRVALEYINPGVTRALLARGLEVIDGVRISEQARVIKSSDEIACMRWAVAVAEHGIAMLKQALKPGVRENQLWALLNYTNLANNGGWHEGRMLASGPRINPWLQEVSDRRIESGDLVGLDTDMVGPFGYFADISRTFHCGPSKPSKRQKQVYQLALEEIEHNLKLIRPGISLLEIQRQAYVPGEEFRDNAYPCILHAVGMCDEYPQVKYPHRQENPYDCELQAGMVLCLESYMGAKGERDGVKLEQQLLVTDAGYELISAYPYEESLLD